MRETVRIIPLTLILAAACSATVATATECSTHIDQNAQKLRELYYYALLTDAADTGALPRWACEVPDRDDLGAPRIHTADTTSTNWNHFAEDSLRQCGFDTGPPCILPLTAADLAGDGERWQQIVDQFGQQGQHVGVYEPPNGGPAHFVCDRDPEDVFALVTLARYQVPVDDDGDLLQLIIRPILWLVETATIEEAVETVTLQKTNSLSADRYPETVTAIRGTRPDRLTNWRSTINRLLRGKSCVFDLMVKLSGHFMGVGRSSYAVTGHSLGGAVAQHVAQHYDRERTSRRFRAFAFNALGTDAPADPAILQSFVIDGDPVPAIGARIGQIQAGRSVRYVPPNTNYWRFERPFATLKRHMLPAVQQALCDCMKGMGTLAVNPKYLGARASFRSPSAQRDALGGLTISFSEWNLGRVNAP